MTKGTELAQSVASQDRDDAAAYIADMTADLAVMARQHGLEILSYVLEMARLEAENAAQRSSSR